MLIKIYCFSLSNTAEMDDSTYEQKFQSLQKYVPFLERMLRGGLHSGLQLQKVQTLLAIITNKKK